MASNKHQSDRTTAERPKLLSKSIVSDSGQGYSTEVASNTITPSSKYII